MFDTLVIHLYKSNQVYLYCYVQITTELTLASDVLCVLCQLATVSMHTLTKMVNMLNIVSPEDQHASKWASITVSHRAADMAVDS